MSDVADFLTISKMSELVNIPESTVRRYCNKFSEFMTYKDLAKGKRYSPKTIEIIEKISTLYDSGYETSEIKEVLSKEYAMTIFHESESDLSSPTAAHVTNNRIIEELINFKKEQEVFNNKLIETIKQQQKYINDSVERRDRELMEVFKKLQENKSLSSQKKHKKKKWWIFGNKNNR